MSGNEEVSIIIRILEVLDEINNLARIGVTSSQNFWTDTAIKIVPKQMLYYQENVELDKRLKRIEAELLTDIPYKFNDSSMRQRITTYQRMAYNEKWANFRERFNQADVDFDSIKSEWLKPKPEMIDLAGKKVEELKLTVKKWKESEMIAIKWTSKFDSLFEEWEQIKVELEKAFKECDQLVSPNNKENQP